MKSSRHERIPNANSPQLLTRLLEMVGRGLRSTRGLQEALGVEGRTVQYYTQAADWLGLLESSGEHHLTPLGLEFVYGGVHRTEIYARAVWNNPFIAQLTTGKDELPDTDAIAAAIAVVEPSMSPSTVRRRASAVRSLIAPAVGSRQDSQALERQLDLPLTSTPKPPSPKPFSSIKLEYDPDIYRFLLQALLDHGELSLGHIRALLDRAGADGAPLGGYVDMAITRGDGRRMEERLVVTPEGIERRHLSETTTSLMLSDPGFRSFIADTSLAAKDRQAAIRRAKTEPRYRGWDQRLFGHPINPIGLEADLKQVLLDRPLNTYPIASGSNIEILPIYAPFLDIWGRRDIAICAPPYLAQLQGGVPAVNRLLRIARENPEVGTPNIASRPLLVHGGIFHPGEILPRNIPDTRSLRQRLLMHSPYAALITALLLLHRQRPRGPCPEHHHGHWTIIREKDQREPLLDVLDRFAQYRGWLCSRAPKTGQAKNLLDALEALGIATRIGPAALLAERFFAQLRSEAEEMEVHVQLAPLAEAFDAWLAA
ncbi:MAG: hypothetical protein HN348_04980 [Proteobacteria bacterium]|nr:hypothetical protein [Pseudomonadota bacterium]